MLESRKKIDIPLKQIPTHQRAGVESQARVACEHEYATRYLESIGVAATKEHKEYMLSNLPIEKALVIPVWTSGSLVMVPERREEVDPNTIKMLYTGSKELDTTATSKNESFYGKGVSAPGTKRSLINGTNRPKTTPINYRGTISNKKSDKEKISPSIHVTFPIDGYLPGREAAGKSFKKLIKPLAVSDVRLKMAIKAFSMALEGFVPQIFDDPTGHLNMTIQRYISTPKCRRLYGLLCHHIFWNIVHPFAHNVLKACRKQYPKLMFSYAGSRGSILSSPASISESRRHSMLSFNQPGFHRDDDDGEKMRSESLSLSCDSDEGEEEEHHNKKYDFNELLDENDSVSTANFSAELSMPESMESNISLSNEEREILYLQLETCISEMHDVLGHQEVVLKYCRQTLVSACHFVVNDIICTHYGWLDEKRNDQYYKDSRKKSHQNANNNTALLKADVNNIRLVRKGVLKSVFYNLTEILDPARVYAPRISKEMFNGEDVTLRDVSQKFPSEAASHGQLRRVRESRDAHRKGKFNSTSLAIQAIFSASNDARTRRFMRASSSESSPPRALSRLGRRRPNKLSDNTSLESSSTFTNSSSLDFSVYTGPRRADDASPTKYTTSGKQISSEAEKSLDVHLFKSMLSSNGIDPNKTSKFGLAPVDVEKTPRLSELDITNKYCKRTTAVPTLAKTEPKQVQLPSKTKTKKNPSGSESFLSCSARANLMQLVVERSKAKYRNETLLQNSRHPNAKYRKDLLSTAGNNGGLKL